MSGLPKILTRVSAQRLGLCIALLINVAIVGAAYFGQQEAIALAGSVDHARAILKTLRLTQNNLVDAEAGQRGYALTGDQKFNKPYDTAVVTLPSELSALRALIEDNPLQRAHVDRLAALMERELTLIKIWSQSTTAGSPTDVVAAGYTHRGKAVMNDVREVLTEMLAEEERVYNDGKAAAGTAAHRAEVMLIAGGVLSLSLILTVFMLMQREMQKRGHSEENLVVTLNSIGDGVAATDEAGRVTRLNPVAEQMTGWRETEACGKPIDEVFRIVNEKTRDPIPVPVAEVIRSGRKVGLANHSVLIGRNGSETVIADSCAPIRDLHGDLLGTVLVFRDVTKDRLAAAAILNLNATLEQQVEERTRSLHRTTEMLQQIIESSPLAILNVDREARIVSWNQRAEEIFGYTAEEAIGRTYGELIGVSREVVLDSLDKILAGRNVKGYEITLKRKDGSNVVLRSFAAPLTDQAGLPVGIVAIMEDITEVRETRNQLQQAQKMEAIGQLTGGVAHDFNNLLSIIVGNLDSLADGLQSPADRELVNAALEGALRGAELTKLMLAFARRQELDPSHIDVGRQLQASSAILTRMLGERIVIQTIALAGLWPCLADRIQFETAVLNLAINGRDAMPEGGTLTIEAANARLDEAYAAQNPGVAPGEYVRISVSDTGGGISPDLLDRVMEPFFTTKDPGKGTGLGLSMVHGFAKQSGGHLKIYSELNHGTTVNLYLPRALGKGESPRQTEHGNATVAKGNETILVVDDNAGVRKTAVMLLTELGYHVFEAVDAKAALDFLGNGIQVDLVFSDVIMPGDMTGFELAKQVSLLYPETKIILVTGYAEGALRQRNNLGDSVQLLSKPYRRLELAVRIRQVLDRSAACPE